MNLKFFLFLIFILVLSAFLAGKGDSNMVNEIPVATKWTMDAAGKTGRAAVESVYMIVCPKTSTKGSGFLLKDGPIITNEHVVRNCQASEIFAMSSFGEKILFKEIFTDSNRDLAILVPKSKIEGGLLLMEKEELQVGRAVSTWGFPLEYNGPAPLLSVGYLSGYIAQLKDRENKIFVKHLVVNGAFNPGNSGGPLFKAGDNKVIGVVVAKHVPFSKFQLSALQALAGNKTGVVFTVTDSKGETVSFVESQLVADLLQHFRALTQVMIGEAVAVSELRAFLKEQQISYSN